MPHELPDEPTKEPTAAAFEASERLRDLLHELDNIVAMAARTSDDLARLRMRSQASALRSSILVAMTELSRRLDNPATWRGPGVADSLACPVS